jgi:hypothetical protein
LAFCVASTAVHDPKEVGRPKVGKRRQRDRVEARPEIDVAADLRETARARAICINQELEERSG